MYIERDSIIREGLLCVPVQTRGACCPDIRIKTHPRLPWNGGGFGRNKSKKVQKCGQIARSLIDANLLGIPQWCPPRRKRLMSMQEPSRRGEQLNYIIRILREILYCLQIIRESMTNVQLWLCWVMSAIS